MKTFCISDIHGCYDELMTLYRKLPINPQTDRMVFLGDYVDRGPDSKQVVQQLIDWKAQYPHWQILYGNHEDLMLDVLRYKGRIYNSYDLWWLQGGKETAYSYLPDGLTAYDKAIITSTDFIPKDHIDFLAGLNRWFEDDHYIYCHGGLKPGKTPQDTILYDMIWIRDEFIDSKYDWGKKVIFGHTAKLEPQVMPNKIGIDTMCCPPGNNKLTCLQLPEEIFYFEVAH